MYDNNSDDHVDEKINTCLSFEKPISFFLFAGAGSGKTRSLVNALNYLREVYAKRLRLHGQRVGVITYTNAACDEIKRRLDFDPLIEVSTIHSFVWSLIGGLNFDIKKWLKVNLADEIADLEEKQSKGRAGTKAALDREKSIETKQKRLSGLDDIKRFTYNPNGDNRGRDSLNHSEVIKIGAAFLRGKPLMQSIFVNKYPILLIDESQDTNKLLMEAFLEIQQKYKSRFMLGLFGDTMQRIYGDGKMDLGQNLPIDWAKPVKEMNHRCPLRIIKLINKIRSAVDEQEQKPRTDKGEGFVRLFILPDAIDKPAAESKVTERIATITGDSLWSGIKRDIKTLTIEHHMVARRMGFWEMFEPLYQEDRLKTGLLDGTLPGLRLFSQLVLPTVKAKQNSDDFSVMAILRKNSPLLTKAALKAEGEDQRSQIKRAIEAISKLLALWKDDSDPRFLDVLHCVAKTGLFEIPESLRPIALRDNAEQEVAEKNGEIPSLEEDYPDSVLDAWDKFLLTPFAQIEHYAAYVNGQAQFETHQGVKGLEFPRVMVIIDDNEARGFLFSYDKLFGVKEKTETDKKNEIEGNDTSIERTRRLFYVTCSRTEESLAIILYSSNPDKVRDHVLSEGWFKNNEVEIVS
ncbi:MAG: UvrD-helicase domain-containing protein [Thermodesulfovibrionales bacterium]|nr:UvrD-helicase domain-containing protein [Thermodesulfovibrionales bacterium]